MLFADVLSNAIVGLDAMAQEDVGRAALAALHPGHPFQCPPVLGALDCALWDLRGKLFGAPVFELLGGSQRDAIPCYASVLSHGEEVETSIRLAKQIVNEGFLGQKWGLRKSLAGIPDVRHYVDFALRLRDAVGPTHLLMFDAFGAWDPGAIVRFCDAARDVDIAWLEEPVPSNFPRLLATLRQRCRVPIAAGEHCYDDASALELLCPTAVDFFQPDFGWCGITVGCRMVAISRAWGIPIIPHGNSVLPALHVATSLPVEVCPMFEYHFAPRFDRLAFLESPPIPEDGYIRAPRTPGIGIAIRGNVAYKSES